MAIIADVRLYNRKANHDKVYVPVIEKIENPQYDAHTNTIVEVTKFDVFGYFGRRSAYDRYGIYRLKEAPRVSFASLDGAMMAFQTLANKKIGEGYTTEEDGLGDCPMISHPSLHVRQEELNKAEEAKEQTTKRKPKVLPNMLNPAKRRMPEEIHRIARKRLIEI